MKILSSVESWNSFFEWASVVFVAGTVFAGAGAIVTSRLIKERQEIAIGKANARAAEANEKAAVLNERAAKLENEAAQARLELEKMKLTRFERLNRDEFRRRIRGKPKIRVELLFPKDDVDSYMLAIAVKGCLDAEGWTAIGPRPIREEDLSFSDMDKDAPPSLRAGVNLGGVSYVAKQMARLGDQNDPINILMSALLGGKHSFPDTKNQHEHISYQGTSDPAVPEDLVKLIIGPRYHDW